MFKKFFVVFTLFSLLAPNFALGLTANELKEHCLAEEPTSSDSLTCLYFIIAAREGMEWGANVATYRTRTEGQTTAEVIQQARRDLNVCIPDDQANRDVINRVFNYLRVSEQSDDKSATRAVYDALSLSYPCN